MAGLDALTAGVGQTDQRDARHAIGGLLAVQGPTALDIRTGVFAGPGSTALVVGTSDTGQMTYAINPHVGVGSRGTANGPYLGPTLDVQTKVNAAPAPGSGSRIDVIYERQRDTTSGVPSPDASPGPEYGVLAGTSTTGTPVKPDLSTIAGATELATAQVSAGATSTNDSHVVITNTARQTVARGGIVPVRATDTDSGAYVGEYRDHPTNGLERWDGVKWSTAQPIGQWVAAVTQSGSYTNIFGGAYADLPFFNVSVTVPAGRQLDVEFKLPQLQVGSGGDAAMKLLIGGVLQDIVEVGCPGGVVAPSLAVPVRLSGAVAGTGASVTVQVQGIAAAGSATAHGTGNSTTDTQGPRLRYRFL